MRILVGMSGGLDSTYAALKLIDEGHEVEGAVLVMHDYTETDAAERAASEIGIKLHRVDCRAAFDEAVKAYFVNEYMNARTPNPCIVCNREVKFKFLLKYALDNGFDAIATGHYAKVKRVMDNDAERFAVFSAEDLKKDQSYMLYRLSQEVLSHLVLPLSELEKTEIRKKAEALGLSSAKSSESQEICFIPDNDYASYIEKACGAVPEGDFVSPDGAILGKHKGIIRYTVGQRKGLGISLGARAFVTDINPENNTVTLDNSPKMSWDITVTDVIFSGVSEQPAGSEMDALVKLRYQAPRVHARVRFLGNGSLVARLYTPAASVTPGQSAVFYAGDKLIFGGFISRKQIF